MYICRYVYMCICIHVHMYTCIYVYMHICIYMHICVYMFLFSFIYKVKAKCVRTSLVKSKLCTNKPGQKQGVYKQAWSKQVYM